MEIILLKSMIKNELVRLKRFVYYTNEKSLNSLFKLIVCQDSISVLYH